MSSRASCWKSEPYVAVALVGLANLMHKLLCDEQPSLLFALFYGACWGALFYASASLLEVFVVSISIFVVVAHGIARRHISVAVIMTAAAAIVVAPWIVRNHKRLGGWFFMRNNDQAQPTELANTESGPFLQIHPNKNLAQALEVRRIGEFRFNLELIERTFEWIAAHPARFLKLTAQRAIYFWFPPARVPVHNVLVGLVSLLGFAGLIWMGRSARLAFWSLLPIWLAYPLVYYVVEYTSRYRAPIQALVLLCAGTAAAAWMSRRAKMTLTTA